MFDMRCKGATRMNVEAHGRSRTQSARALSHRAAAHRKNAAFFRLELLLPPLPAQRICLHACLQPGIGCIVAAAPATHWRMRWHGGCAAAALIVRAPRLASTINARKNRVADTGSFFKSIGRALREEYHHIPLRVNSIVESELVEALFEHMHTVFDLDRSSCCTFIFLSQRKGV